MNLAMKLIDRLIWIHDWYICGAASGAAMADAESSFRTDVQGDLTLTNHAYGLFQWRLDRYDGTLHPLDRKYIGLLQYASLYGPNKLESDWTDWTVQVDYFNFDRARRSAAEQNWHVCTNITQGVLAGQKFESYSGPLQPKRTALAQAFHDNWLKINPHYSGM